MSLLDLVLYGIVIAVVIVGVVGFIIAAFKDDEK